MKVTFLKDCQPMPQVGNTARSKHDTADFRAGHAQWLIDNGYARRGWDATETKSVFSEPSYTTEILSNFVKPIVTENRTLTLSELRQAAKKVGIKGYARMKRETLLERLAGGDN